MMNVGLVVESDESVEYLIPMVLEMSHSIERFFSGRHYGPDVIEVIICLILMGDPVSKRLHPLRSFAYKRYDTEISRITGEVFEIHKSASWDIRPSLTSLGDMELDAVRRYFCELLISSAVVLEEHRDQYPNFDVDRFRSDFAYCLRCGEQKS